MYLSDWDKYDFVNVSTNIGAGVAPWNIQKFICIEENNKKYVIDRKTKVRNELIFYHFQNVVNNRRYIVSILPLLSYWKIDKKFVYSIYLTYLKVLEMYKNSIEKEFDFLPIVYEYITDSAPRQNYLKRIIRHPIKSIPEITHRFSLFVLKIVRKKSAYINLETI